MKHWFVFFLALASVGSVKGQQTITLSNGNMVAGAYKQPPTRTVKSVDDGYIITYTFALLADISGGTWGVARNFCIFLTKDRALLT